MKFSDIPAGIQTFRVARTDHSTGSLAEQPVFSVAACLSRPGEFEILLTDRVIFVKPAVKADTRRLGAELCSGRALLAQLANPAADGSIELQIAFFAGECVEMGDVEIGVDEYVERECARQKLRGNKLYETLARQCSYVHGIHPYFFLFAGPAIDRSLRAGPDEEQGEAQKKNDEDEERVEAEAAPDAVQEASPPRTAPTRKNSFCVMGDEIRFVASVASRPDGQSIYIATRLTRRKADPDRALRLARGRLTFSDWTQTGQIQSLVQAQMSALTRDDGSYLKKWDEFVGIEGKLLLEQARDIGALEYSDMTPNRDGTATVHITHASDSALNALGLNKVESVEVAEDLPEYLKKPELSFEQFTSDIELKAEGEALVGKRAKQRKETKQHFTVSAYDAAARLLTIKTENLPVCGTLILSLAGQETQIKRRLFARKAILEGRAANPQLGLLIEENGSIAPTRPPAKITPLTEFVLNKVFRNSPTIRQRDAIDIALNTPDIALIQGPPGTGKTTVIAAIIERLNEIADKRGKKNKGLVLLTGFQHDAVENMIGRLSLNGVPVPKFGRRSGAEEDDFNAFERKLEEWCAEKARALRATNPQLATIEQEAQIKNLCLQYLMAPSRALALRLAERIAQLGILILGEDCSRRAAQLARKLAQEEQLNEPSRPLLESLRRLRHRPESFADDGPERAVDTLDDLHDFLEKTERDLLDKASLWRTEDGVPPFLNDLAALKMKLLARFTAPPVFRVEKLNDALIALVKEASARIVTNGATAKDAKSAALVEFLAELESNPYGMIDAVSDYAYAFSATCQQSVNRRMQEQKGISEINSTAEFQKLEYDYVVVDEAARVSPPDLLVAMAQGKRIILVGDHRQLPHIVDEKVIGRLSEAAEDDLLAAESTIERNEENWSKTSLFEYMFVKRLPQLEKQDGFPRRVTLDAQYRMHPLLGSFVSRNFYERFDPSEKFKSGRPESDFKHNLPATEGRPAIWLDVPASRGKHDKDGTSWIRRVEATAIAQQLQAWIKSKEGQDLSFGVISFYKSQAKLIQKQLGSIIDDGKKLRIGTVDSFQGMEFDVVILSMVRTLRPDWKPRMDDEEKQAQALFGHLCLYNRLNVSMSRQKKLLVVAGDSGLLQNDLAAKYIPGLVDFHNLCRTHGRVLRCR